MEISARGFLSPAREMNPCFFVALRPRKTSLVKVFDLSFDGAIKGRRLSHEEHITISKLLILNGFMALCAPFLIVSEPTLASEII